MALKAWYWLKRVLVPMPHVRVPTAAFFTDVKATVYAEQLSILDSAAFGCSDISELGLSLPEAEQSPDSVTFKHLNRRHPPPNAKRALGGCHPLRPLQRSHRKAQRHLVSCPQEPTASFSHTVGAAVLSPRDGRTLLRPKWKRCLVPNLSISPSPSIISGVRPNIQHLLEPCHFTELDPVCMGTIAFMVSRELEP
ncbi:hypothetical protein TNIN_32501 [Trichonephila inaurata madagascariensis]|uniref:Uncharacterized protein n=1 Tax=Trichonephila inaurata madagascariensis TaxID=2747483 RepID=A0A8X6XJT2_9ARAC|nr:hypothetical protein TNIN_32501 [Trichonephila inaurata madagascariensis]